MKYKLSLQNICKKNRLEWFYKVPGGIVPLTEDYSSIAVEPVQDLGLEWAKTTVATKFGRIIVSWDTGGDIPRLYVFAPEGVHVKTAFGEFDGDGKGHDFPDLSYPW